MISAEVVPASGTRAGPAIFLVHRRTSQAIVVASWPAVAADSGAAPPGEKALLDLDSHFAPITGAAGASPPPCPPVAPPRPPPQCALAIGDRVEVEYQGHWFTGVLQDVDGGEASVRCDVDSPGVLTVAPLTSVRPIASGRRPRSPPKESQEDAAAIPSHRGSLRHVRAKSAM